MRHCCILRHNTPEPALSKDPKPHTVPKLVAFCDTRRKTTLSDPITPCIARIPRAALTDKVIPDNDKNVFTNWHSSCSNNYRRSQIRFNITVKSKNKATL